MLISSLQKVRGDADGSFSSLGSVGSAYRRLLNGASRQHFFPGDGAEETELVYSCHGMNTVVKRGGKKLIFTAVPEVVSRVQSEHLFLRKDALLPLSYPQGYPTSHDLSFSRSTEGHQMFSYSRQSAALFCFCPELPCFSGKMFPFSHLFNAFPKGHHKHIMFLCVGSSFQDLFAESPQ